MSRSLNSIVTTSPNEDAKFGSPPSQARVNSLLVPTSRMQSARLASQSGTAMGGRSRPLCAVIAETRSQETDGRRIDFLPSVSCCRRHPDVSFLQVLRVRAARLGIGSVRTIGHRPHWIMWTLRVDEPLPLASPTFQSNDPVSSRTLCSWRSGPHVIQGRYPQPFESPFDRPNLGKNRRRRGARAVRTGRDIRIATAARRCRSRAHRIPQSELVVAATFPPIGLSDLTSERAFIRREKNIPVPAARRV